ncbi:MAG: ABC transporter permease subunit [Nitrospinales bacterium]
MSQNSIPRSPRGFPLSVLNLRSSPNIGRRQWVDRLGRFLFTLGGGTVIVAIFSILLVILAAVYPLFAKPKVHLDQAFSFANKGSVFLAAGVDERREIVYGVAESGLHLFSLKENGPLVSPNIPELGKTQVVAAVKPGRNFLVLGLSDGRVLPIQIRFEAVFSKGKRNINVKLEVEDPIQIAPQGAPVLKLASISDDNGFRVAAVTAPKTIALATITERETMMGTRIRKEYKKRFELSAKGKITSLLMATESNALLVGTSSGQILRVDLGEPDEDEVRVDVMGATMGENVGVSSLGFLVGGQTLVAGDEAGRISSYQFFERDDGKFKMAKIHSFEPHEKPVTIFDASSRNRGFITGDSGGTLRYHFGTSGLTQFTLPMKERDGLVLAALAPKANGLVLVDAAGRFFNWALDHPHPEISWQTLFGKVAYESYPQPEYVWQSTGGTDEFESKFSLVPLVYGALKGTFYAILFAVPLAVFGAFYTSQFMHPAYRNIVKPVIEVMAALPSIVLGFFAALWLAPRVEKILPGIAVAPVVIATLVVLYLIGREYYPFLFRTPGKQGSEILILAALVILGSGISLYLGRAVESIWLQGDYKSWLNNVLGLSYDQRNSLVVGIAMGFAVIPIIFSIAEDSLSNVPAHLKSGSLALGATPWQTAIHVVLPTASPGIFSAIMIGFGRAIGETMIVLMATGNTPIMDLNLFNGFRALSANIAVELPEAPEGGTLFRILFLTALLLFILTFFINTLAEGVRLHLRKKYKLL